MVTSNQSYYNFTNSAFLSQSILDVFVLQNLIDQEDADRLSQRLKTNRQIEEFLLGNHVVSKDTINKAYSIILKLPYIELRTVRIPDDLKKIVTEKIARKFGIIAFSQDEGMVRIAISKPSDILTGFQSGLKDLFSKKKLEVELFITGETDFLECLRQYSSKNSPLLLKKGSLPVIYLRNQPIDSSYLKKFPAEFVAKYRLVVFGQNQRGHYLIACEEPDSPVTMKILDFIKKENKVNIEQFATSRDDIDYIIARINGKSDLAQNSEAESTESAEPSQGKTDERPADREKDTTSPPVAKDVKESPSVIKGLINSLLESTRPAFTIDEVEALKENQDRAPKAETDRETSGSSQSTETASTPAQSGTVAKEGTDPSAVNGQTPLTETEREVDGSTPTLPEKAKSNGPDQSTASTDPIKDIAEAKKREEDAFDDQSKQADENDLGSLITEDIVNEKMLEDIIKEGVIPKIVAAVINYALLKKASDIHVEPEGKSLRIRCRVDGILRDVASLPLKDHPPFLSRIKIMSKLKIDESRIPQDGRFDVKFKNHEVDVRVSTLPTVHGEKAVMRILDKSQGILSLEDLGMQGSAFEQTNLAIAKPYGILLATGPTGSGKSTTLYAVLNRISVPGVNIVTLEDPVEYEIAGINQCQIKPEIGFTFASGLRSILRQDPNVIMVGEIRDAETASMATHAALTGHLVLSTLHTNDTAGALPRLINMGVEPFLITSSLNLVIAQRLVRRICLKCREEVRVPQRLMDELKAELAKIPANNTKDRERIPAELKLYHGKGCPECTNGFKGRIGIYEVMMISPSIEELAIGKRSSNEIKETAIKEGMITMKQDGILKAFTGETTIDEVFQAVINS